MNTKEKILKEKERLLYMRNFSRIPDLFRQASQLRKGMTWSVYSNSREMVIKLPDCGWGMRRK